MHPDYSRLVSFYNVHFVVRAVLSGQVLRLPDIHATVLLSNKIVIIHHILTALRELVFETCFQALV